MSAQAPPGPPPADWHPTRLGVSYRPRRLAIEYETDQGLFRKLLPISAHSSDPAPEAVLRGLEARFAAFLDFDNKLSRA